jgi:hypothetical protein
MNTLLRWPRLYLRVVHVVVGALGAYLSILKIMSLVLGIMVWHVGKNTALTYHAREQWQKRVRS